MKILIVIVLFGQRLEECETYKTLISKYRQYDLFVFDNSPVSQHDAEEFGGTNIHYKADRANPGLSYAYNRALEYGLKSGCQWLLIADQDTSFSSDIIAHYRQAVESNPEIKMFVPCIISGSGSAISPIMLRSYFNCKGVRVKATELSSERYVAINSGMMVNVEAALSVGGYNQAVWLDHSDFQFVERFAKLHKSFYVIDSLCVQNLSTETNSKSQSLTRFKIFCSCAKACNKPTPRKRFSYAILVMKRALRLALSTMSFRALAIAVKYYF